MKTKSFGIAIFLLSTLLFSNCSKDELERSIVFDREIIDPDENSMPKLCTELYVDQAARAFGSKTNFWNTQVLRVRFLGGSAYVQNKVKHLLFNGPPMQIFSSSL